MQLDPPNFHENFIEHYEKYIPLEAYLYFPTNNEIKAGEEKKGYRRIYEGQVQYDIWELDTLMDFQRYLIKNKYKTIAWWNEANILRFLYANKFKFDKTFKAIQNHSEWRQIKLPAKYTANIQKFLNAGFIYIHGRDNRFRPIIVFKPSKLSLKESDLELIIDSLTYLLQFVIENLLLPGQIENWNFIIDLNNMGMSSLPLSLIKKVLSYMQNNFRSRLFQMYIVNSPKSINLVWAIVKGFLEEATVRKINILTAHIPENLFNHTNKSQVEGYFGGTSPNLMEDFWPPHFPSAQYLLPNEVKEAVLITREKYVELLEQKLLKNNVICRDLIEIKETKPHTSSKNFDMSTPNPDHEEMLKKVKEQENDAQIDHKQNGIENKGNGKKGLSVRGQNQWNESMDVEEEKNNIQSLCENVFRMKSFLDEKFEHVIKSMN